MRLHELTLENFRAVEQRTVTFPDAGIVVVAGENERGKTTMIEALDILLSFKSSATRREVRQAQPIGSDVAPAVEAVMTLGEHQVRYRKQFLRQHSTTLTFLEGPRAGTALTGDEAHDTVAALHSGTDRQLWQALRLLQATGLDAPALEDSAALQKALDRRAGGETSGSLGEGDSLAERVESEYLRYFTPTGKPTGDFAKAGAELRTRAEAAEAARAALAEVEALADRLAAAEERVGHAEEALQAHAGRAKASADALAGIEAAQRRRDEAEHRHALTESAVVAAREAHSARAALVAAREARAAEHRAAEAALGEASEALAPWRESAEEAQAALALTRDALAEARAATAAARAKEAASQAREEARRLAEIVDGLDRSAPRLGALRTLVESVAFEAPDLEKLEAAEKALTSAEAALGAGSARLGIQRRGEGPALIVDGEHADDGAEYPITRPLEVEIPGAWGLTLSPAAGTQERQDDVERARSARGALLDALGVSSAAEGHARLRERESARAELAALEAERRALLGGRAEADVRAEVEESRAGTEGGQEFDAAAEAGDSAQTGGPSQARATLSAALDAQAVAEDAEAEAARTVEASRAGHQEARDAHTRASANVATARAAAEAAEALLSSAREKESDEALEAAFGAASSAAEEAAAGLAEAERAFQSLAPESVRAEAETATREASGLAAALQAAKEERTRLDGELTGQGGERRQADADAAEAAEQVARGEHARLERRAQAAQVLRETLLRHRDAARARYVAPFAEAIATLGRPVFGPDFRVGVGDSLALESRTLGGVTVPFELLSSGAKEQLGIIVRLAAAMLVDPEDGVPVLLDDALGYSDDHRRSRVLSVLGRAAESTQVIVLTCTPERYAALRGQPDVAFEMV